VRTLFVGDVHGCADELAALIERAAADQIILVGDLFTKGPDPAGVWDIIQQTRARSVLGNHDAFVLRRLQRRGQLLAPAAAVDWLAELPLTLSGPGWIAVHAGLHPTEGIPGTTAAIATEVRRWPDDCEDSNPFWWKLYKGPGLVLYGHDARRGLKDRRPLTLGLDTGCVYGGALTGYLLEADTILSVLARKDYCPIR
jgi:hypothetical protein